MKLKRFLKILNAMVKHDPSLKELTVVCSIDDEGNGFNEVFFLPAVGEFDIHDRDFRVYNADFEADEEDAVEKEDINAICIN